MAEVVHSAPERLEGLKPMDAPPIFDELDGRALNDRARVLLGQVKGTPHPISHCHHHPSARVNHTAPRRGSMRASPPRLRCTVPPSPFRTMPAQLRSSRAHARACGAARSGGGANGCGGGGDALRAGVLMRVVLAAAAGGGAAGAQGVQRGVVGGGGHRPSARPPAQGRRGAAFAGRVGAWRRRYSRRLGAMTTRRCVGWRLSAGAGAPRPPRAGCAAAAAHGRHAGAAQGPVSSSAMFWGMHVRGGGGTARSAPASAKAAGRRGPRMMI
jgi:hypothetical protein